MWRKNTALLLILPLASVLLFPGCATLTQKSTQRIPITSSPAGAEVSVNGVRKGVTPFQVKVPRKRTGQVIRIESPGYNPVEIRIRRTGASLLIGDVLLGGAAGFMIGWSIFESDDETGDYGTVVWTTIAATICSFFLIDMATGAGFELNPSDLNVTLTKAEGSPRVDTMLVDAEDFQNIKWIRVRRD
jgi:hypothetical protein